MIKFLHKKHIHYSDKSSRLVIYYSVSDIVLGTLLMILVAFFVNDYLTTHFFSKNPNMVNTGYHAQMGNPYGTSTHYMNVDPRMQAPVRESL